MDKDAPGNWLLQTRPLLAAQCAVISTTQLVSDVGRRTERVAGDSMPKRVGRDPAPTVWNVTLTDGVERHAASTEWNGPLTTAAQSTSR